MLFNDMSVLLKVCKRYGGLPVPIALPVLSYHLKGGATFWKLVKALETLLKGLYVISA